MHYLNTTALITGASSGIGREFARAFASRGADVVLVGRNVEGLEHLAKSLRENYGGKVFTVVLDLSRSGSGDTLLNEIARRDVRIDTVVNCAGVGLTRDFLETAADGIDEQLATNVDAIVDISRAFLPGLVASGVGALVNIASLTAYMPTPGMAIYAASKAFVLRFTVALAYELRHSGVTVMAFSPGPTKTEFYRNSGSSERGVRFETPEQVVGAALHALDRAKPPFSSVSGRANTWASRIVGLLPSRAVLRLVSASPR